MSTEEEYKELSAKLRYGLELAEQRLIEDTAKREGTLCYGCADGKVIRVSASELLKLRENISRESENAEADYYSVLSNW
ncbi:hypothetical protein [Phocaeicola paurosaccharolyticus]|jgi:hypothetical protein|uniref:hypothetical protein n=1 Tax=Phocaeicola paurosaccharolyticus TaxID=732242 RepID=UPI0004680E35|nr:hypothetical protein [Phocaeicola paurosaccharolyticus]